MGRRARGARGLGELGRAMAVLACVLPGCESGAPPIARGHEAPGSPAPSVAPQHPAGPRFLHYPGGEDPRPFVVESARRARAEGGAVLVYVGATWCEPCARFHAAAERGELDALLAGVRLLEFDLDEHGEALRRAGYGSRLVPLFAVPAPDGTSSALRIEGSVKGDRAVRDDLAPRLAALLAAGRGRAR